MHKLPSQKLYDLLSGNTEWEDADASIRSWAQFEIYKGAVDVLKLPTKEERRVMLSRIPASIRPHVEAEALRLWRMNK